MRFLSPYALGVIYWGCGGGSTDHSETHESDRIDDPVPAQTVPREQPLKGILKKGAASAGNGHKKAVRFNSGLEVMKIPTRNEVKAEMETGVAMPVKPNINLQAVKELSNISASIPRPTTVAYPGDAQCGWAANRLMLKGIDRRIQFNKLNPSGVFKSDGGGSAFVLMVSRTDRSMYQDALQLKLNTLSDTRDMVVKYYPVDFHAGPDIVNCTPFFHVEEEYGAPLSAFGGALSIKSIADLAARGIGILKSLHSVGLVDGDLASDLVWKNRNPKTLKIRSFKESELFVDPNTGIHVAVDTCETAKIVKNFRGILISPRSAKVANCKSRAFDLIQFAVILTELLEISGHARQPDISEFTETAIDLGFREEFEYDSWIERFNTLATV